MNICSSAEMTLEECRKCTHGFGVTTHHSDCTHRFGILTDNAPCRFHRPRSSITCLRATVYHRNVAG